MKVVLVVLHTRKVCLSHQNIFHVMYSKITNFVHTDNKIVQYLGDSFCRNVVNIWLHGSFFSGIVCELFSHSLPFNTPTKLKSNEIVGHQNPSSNSAGYRFHRIISKETWKKRNTSLLASGLEPSCWKQVEFIEMPYPISKVTNASLSTMRWTSQVNTGPSIPSLGNEHRSVTVSA